MSYRRPSVHRRSLAFAVHLALCAGVAHAADTQDLRYFPAYLDGYLVPTADGLVHHTANQLETDIQNVAATFCASDASWQSCAPRTQALREIKGKPETKSAYSVLDITFDIVDAFGREGERVTNGGILAVRACPDDAALVDDAARMVDNRAAQSGKQPVACIAPDDVPKGTSLGRPEESGANQCPIGNSRTVGNPINPLTMSKIETVVDYTGPAASGLVFGRTYQSGAFSLTTHFGRPFVRYPAGARIGTGWRHTWDRAFVRRNFYNAQGLIYDSALHLVREDGNETRFVKQGDTFVPVDGARGTLRDHPEGGWMYTLPDLTVERYDGTGRLRSRKDPNGNEVTLHYGDITVGIGFKTSVLVRVTDRQGRELRLSYDRMGRLETVDTPDGRINYSYNGGILEGLDADLAQVKYPDGRRVRYLYDEPAMGGTPNHKLTGIIGNDGKRFATFEYDEYNRAIRSSHGDGLEWTEVDPWADDRTVSIHTKDRRYAEIWKAVFDQGRIRLGELDQNGRASRHFDYLGGGLVGRQTDYLGVPTTYRYDRYRQLETERTEAEGTPVARTVKTTWHPVFDKPTRIDRGTQWTTFDYDVKGNLTEQREGGKADAADAQSSPWPDERITRYTYDAAGRLLTVDGPLAGTDDTFHYAYYEADAPECATPGATCTWRKGDLHTVTNPLGHVETILAYDAAGRALSSVDINGVRTDRRFDAMGRPLEVAVRANRDGSPSAGDLVTRPTYTANGDIDVLTDPDGVTLAHRYNAAHRLVEQVDAVGHRRLVEYDGEGRVKTETWHRADGIDDVVRTTSYHSSGAVHSIEHADGSNVTYWRDAAGRLLETAGLLTGLTMSRDALGRVETVSEARAGEEGDARLSYDAIDQVKTVVDPKGLSTSYLRNGLGDLLWQRSPDTGDTAFDNDVAGRPVKETPADNRHVERDYDRLGRVTKVTYSDGQITSYTYDAVSPLCDSNARYGVGRLGAVTETSGSTAICYDFAGRVVQKTQIAESVRLDLRYAYTPAGRLAAITYPDGNQVTYLRDAAGRVTGVETHAPLAAAQSLLTDVRHDSIGHPIQWTAGSRTIARTYNGFGMVTSTRDERTDGLKIDLAYKDDGIDIKADRTKFTVEFDLSQRVSSTSVGFFDINFYDYDGTGNRKSRNTVSSFHRYQYAPSSHHLLVAEKIPREYDATGNTTKIGEREFVYDATGRLTQAKVNGVAEMNYAYNAFGQQVAKSIAGTTTVSLHDEAGHWIGDYDGAGNPIRQIVWLDDLPVAVLDGDTIRDIQPDHLGTPRVVIDRATDKAIWTWSITGEPFGNTPPNEDPDKDGSKYVFDMRFPGQRYDAVTGLFQNGWRDYDPTSGRYIQSDPIGLAGGISTYAYVGSNPYTRTDTNGLHVNGVYNKKANQLTLVDSDTGAMVTQAFISGGKPYGAPIPSGWYDVLERKGKDDFYRLEPIDSMYGDDTHDGSGRTNFRLHRPGLTVGCISANSWDDWGPIDGLIKQTSTDRITVPSKSKKPWGPKSEELTRYGRIRVED